MSQIATESGWSARYAFMTVMSAGIAVLGLLLSSPAVVIGAMLISPLMNPILGLGFSLARFDFAETRRSLLAIVLGSALAVAFAALIVLASPLKAATPEILARTRPNLFDLVVALFSALAGVFAIIRGLSGVVVGVAIATALMPPLAVVGYGLATWNFPVLWGALALFVTNFVTIALSATIMARTFGFGRALSPHQSVIQTVLVILVFAALALPLGVSLNQIARETANVAKVRRVLGEVFGEHARISQLAIDFEASPLAVRSVVITPRSRSKPVSAVQSELARRLGRPITLQLDEIMLDRGNNNLEAQRAQLDAAEAARSIARQEAERVAEAVGAAAGVPASAVLVDPARNRATASMAVLPGADLETYQQLERRASDLFSADGWVINLIPPVQPLPLIRFHAGSEDLDESALRAVVASAWAGQRWNSPGLRVPGLPEPDAPKRGRPTLAQRRAAVIARILLEQGLRALPAPPNGRTLRLSLPLA